MKSSIRQTATPQHWSRPRGNDRIHPKTPSSGQHSRRQFLRLAAGAATLPQDSPDQAFPLSCSARGGFWPISEAPEANLWVRLPRVQRPLGREL
jgi:hypothetical protein